ncbi:MAG: 2-phospho-L-lactate transferase [Chloroflexi bacterium]|nr:2-phospho-L-lactate transferase [Chloroflexota bacterium]MCI0579070.1 2-phospho-L-lactate transferase [Chloroflexota bacterium]MCI0649348.1 2-phospho-L-lactate transferase [Chloroflexota bacterium]MCI0730156.1 2-phospho-L-lactate transferase [Chloroflexota bacterium]
MNHAFISQLKVVVLAGGVGGAKLADGFAQLLPAANLAVIVNTGDDFQHLGLTICPDLDTVIYTLAGLANPETGWGRAGESWRTMAEVGRLAGPTWFRLGDLDLATHLVRSHLLAAGATLTEATHHLCRHLGLAAAVLPMSNQPAPTLVETGEGVLSFQTWFVERQWQPAVQGIYLPEDVRATPQVLWALEKADLIAIAPSNPFVSINPILNVYPIRAMITDLPQLVIAVSPIIGGKAVKGPAAKMMAELGMEVTPAAVANVYGELIDAFVYDEQDAGSLDNPELATLTTNILMQSPADRRRLAAQILDFSMELIDQ